MIKCTKNIPILLVVSISIVTSMLFYKEAKALPKDCNYDSTTQICCKVTINCTNPEFPFDYHCNGAIVSKGNACPY